MSMRTADADDYVVDSTGRGANQMRGESDSFSLIDRYSNFDGTFRSSRDLRIDGEVKGTIECQGTLLVAQGANVTAKVEAENITVAGDLNGDIRCRGRLQIMPSGQVRGKVMTETLVINEGAFYEGQLEMSGMALESKPVNGPRPLPPISSAPPQAPPMAPPQESRPARSAQAEASTSPSGSTTFIRRFGGPETPWEPSDNEEAEDPAKRDG
jgi:cytoskeletal protein CcmA (bactofilin family)